MSITATIRCPDIRRSPPTVTERHRLGVGLGAESGHVHQLEEPSHDEGQSGHDEEHVDAALTDHVESERQRHVRDRRDDARAVGDTAPQKPADPDGADGDGEDQRQARQDAHASEDERAGEGEHRVAGHARRTGADAVRRPRREEVAPHRPPGIERRESSDQREVRHDEIARADEPQDDDHEHHGGLRAKRRQDPRRTATQFHHRALGDVVELLLLGEGRRETDRVGVELVVLERLGRQDAAGAVESLAHQEDEEALESTRSPDLQSSQLLVGEDLDLVALASALADATPVVK